MATKLSRFNFGKIKDFFSFKKKVFLGIDIGTSAIRVVEASKKNKTFQLKNYGEVQNTVFKKRPFRIFYKNAISLSNKEISEAIKSILKETNIVTKQVSFAIPDFASFFTTFEIPTMDENEIPQAIQYEVRPYVPIPIHEVTLDWAIIGGQISSTPLKVLVVAIPNDTIAQYQEIAQMAELELKSLESEVFSLARAARSYSEGKADAKKVLGLLDIGARSTTCSVLDAGVLKSSHSFQVGGNELTEIVAKGLNIEYNRGEELKIEKGLISGVNQQIRKILIPLVDSIIQESKEAFRVFFRKEGKRVEKVLIAGGVASMPGLKEYFAAGLEKPVVILNPFLNLTYPKILGSTLKKMGPSYSIAVGLALGGLEKK
jgi:type IV pilus assembly protein PilM